MRIFSATVLCLCATLAATGVAAAATAPTASTGPVTSTAPTTATVSGSVTPQGTATTWYVEYGTSATYGAKTSSVSAGSGTSSTSVSASLTTLKPGTTYHYRVVATSTAGTGRGADGIVTTSSVPAAITGSVTAVTTTSATLNGTVDPSGRPTTWYFEYGTSTSYGTKTPVKDAGSGTGAISVAAAVTRLKAGRTYHMRLVATNDAGRSRGSDQAFFTSAAPVITTKAATSVKDTTATLNGSVNPNGQATNVYFEYGTSAAYGTKTPVVSAGTGTSARSMSAPVSGLTGGATYHFRVVATNAAGTTTGADLTFATAGKPVPRTGTPSGVTETSATLTGTVDPDGHTTSWYFEYGTTTRYGTKTASHDAGSSIGAKPVTVSINGLTAGTAYHLRLVATSSAGTVYGADVAFSTAGPPVTIAVSSSTAIYRHRVTLRGRVSSRQANVPVGLFFARVGGGSFASLATVLTGTEGTWSFVVRPPIATTYKVLFAGGSAVATISVRPAVSLVSIGHGRFSTHVAGARSFAHKLVQLQRHRLDGRWVTISHNRLSSRSTAVFHPRLPHGRSHLRVAIGATQVGVGYVAGYSAWLTLRR